MVEQLMTLNLRRGFINVPTWRKSKRAAEEVRTQIMHYAKVNEVVISKWVNEAIWARGARSPPPKIKLKLDVDKEKKIAKVELFELPLAAKRLVEKQKQLEAAAKKKEEVKKAKETKEEKAEAKDASGASSAAPRQAEPGSGETKKEQAKMTQAQEHAMK